MRGLYGIADAGFGDPVALGRMLLDAGACAVQLRCKGWPPDRVAAALRALAPDCRAAGVPLLVNDHPALAALADGVHLGQDDGAFPAQAGLRGRSTHSLADLEAALAEGVDYVGFGPVYGTTTRVGALPARGLPALAAVCAAAPCPVVAIGGITLTRLPEVQAAGAPCWALISALFAAAEPLGAARQAARLTDCQGPSVRLSGP